MTARDQLLQSVRSPHGFSRWALSLALPAVAREVFRGDRQWWPPGRTNCAGCSASLFFPLGLHLCCTRPSAHPRTLIFRIFFHVSFFSSDTISVPPSPVCVPYFSLCDVRPIARSQTVVRILRYLCTFVLHYAGKSKPQTRVLDVRQAMILYRCINYGRCSFI